MIGQEASQHPHNHDELVGMLDDLDTLGVSLSYWQINLVDRLMRKDHDGLPFTTREAEQIRSLHREKGL
jgi:hypothetical protein